MIPIMQGSGLIFKDLFPLLNINATQSSTIISTNMAFGMILGLINGPLLRYFGYRKVAIAGSLLYSIGITLTTFSTTFTLIMITYGLIACMWNFFFFCISFVLLRSRTSYNLISFFFCVLSCRTDTFRIGLFSRTQHLLHDEERTCDRLGHHYYGNRFDLYATNDNLLARLLWAQGSLGFYLDRLFDVFISIIHQ